MIRLEGVSKNKEKILATMRMKGPSLPVQVARSIETSMLFASAYLSELKAEGKLRISNMRVGSSPLYFLEGQEPQLENFVQHLNQREKEAFNLLKEKRVLKDSKQEPVVRVALRAIKDFALPVRVRVGSEAELYWKFFGVGDEEVSRHVKGKNTGSKSAQSTQLKQKEEVIEKREVIERKEVVKEKKPKVQENLFTKKVKDYLRGKDIEVLEVISEKKREFEARVRVDSLFGKQEYCLIAKDKKNINDNDLALASQRARSKKMLALFLSSGELNNRAKEHLDEWKNLVKWERLKF
jgi:hypothetical protein